MSEVKSRPILFSAPMIQALLAGTKTQTRRALKFPKWSDAHGGVEFSGLDDGPSVIAKVSGCFADLPCPYGVPGDYLWCRETWARYKIDQDSHCTAYRATQPADWPEGGNWRPSIFMPRRESRITLRMTEVRLQRLQEISEADAIAEGCPAVSLFDLDCDSTPPSHYYRDLWESINGSGSWAANPLVWAISFDVIKRNVDQLPA